MTDLTLQVDASTQGQAEMPQTSQDKPEQIALRKSLLVFAQFGAGVVHNVNAPLAVSLLSAQMALRALKTDGDPTARRCLERVIDGIRTAASAIRETVSESNDRAAICEQFDVRDVLRFAVILIRDHAHSNSCALDWKVSLDESPISGNPIELEIGLVSCLCDIISSGATSVTLITRSGPSWITIQIEAQQGECNCLELIQHFASKQNGTFTHRLRDGTHKISIRLERSNK